MADKNICPKCQEPLGTGTSAKHCPVAGHYVRATNLGPAAEFAETLRQQRPDVAKGKKTA